MTRHHLAGPVVSRDEHERLIHANGFLLGVSRDAWIVLGAMLGGTVASILIVLVFVRSAVAWRADWLGRDIPVDAEGRIQQPKFPVGALQTLFRYDLNSFFAYRADLAVRCALACAVCGLPYVLPELGFMNDYGWSMQYVVVIICFSVFMDLGNTVACAWYNFYGTLLPTINVILMYSFYPHGATAHEGDFVWYFGLADFIIFNGAFLMLKVPVGVRMFALSWQAYFSMCFLNPNDDTRFSHGLSDVVLQGAAIGPLMGTVIGSVISVCVVCSSPFGYTLCGIGRAQEAAMTVLWKEGELWRRMVTYYTGKEKLLEIESLIGHAKDLERGVEELDSFLSMTWWETFDIGRPGRVRAHLIELNKTLRLAHDWLKCILQSIAEEDFNDQHDALMEKLAPAIVNLSENIAKLMFREAKLASAGFSISSARGAEAQLLKYEQQQLQADIAAVNGAQRELAKEFVRIRREVYGSDVITPDATGEHFFMYALSVYGEYATEYAEYLMKDHRSAAVSIPMACYHGVLDTLAINDGEFILRSGMGFFGAFLIGYMGMAKGIMPAYSSTAAGTTAYLLAAEGKTGSAIMKNVARFQGTAGGTLLGQLIYHTVMGCSPAGNICGFIAIMIFEFFAFYLYFSSPSYGYVGLLLAAYGAQHMLIACDSSANNGDSVYMTIIDQSMAIICVSAADVIVGNRSSGHMAAGLFFDLSRDVRSVLDKFYSTSEARSKRLIDAHVKTPQQKAAAASSLLSAMMPAADPLPLQDRDGLSLTLRSKYVGAIDMGEEASLEPRFYRIPFKERFWKAVTSAGEGIVVKTCIMHAATHLKGDLKAEVQEVVGHVTESATFRKQVEAMMERWSTVYYLAEQIMMNETLAPLNVPASLAKALSSAVFLDMEADMDQLLKEVNEKLCKTDPEKLQSCAMEERCLACVIIEMTNGIIKKINAMEDACFQERDMEIEEE